MMQEEPVTMRGHVITKRKREKVRVFPDKTEVSCEEANDGSGQGKTFRTLQQWEGFFTEH